MPHRATSSSITRMDRRERERERDGQEVKAQAPRVCGWEICNVIFAGP